MTALAAPALRDLTSLDDCRLVVDAQVAVWGEVSDIVPASLLTVSAKRGGILVGAFDGGELVGFVWSLQGRLDGQPTQWSHMLGVLPTSRTSGVGRALKLAQRARALAQGVELVEWTFDPLQAVNAHFNVARLGAVASTYQRDAYGALDGDLHRGTPTDRLVAEWWITRPHVRRRIEASSELTARSVDVLGAVPAIETRLSASGEWLEVAAVRDSLKAERIEIAVPPEFTRMQREALDVAQAWRLATRQAFESAFTRGFRVVDFSYDRERGGGRYLLATAG